MTTVTSQTERAPGSSSARAWRYSAHELGAIDLIARERLRRCRDDVAWGDLWPSFDRLRFGLRSVVNAAKHALVIAPGSAGLAVEKDPEPLPAFADDPAHVGFPPIGPSPECPARRARGRRDADHRSQPKRRPESRPLRTLTVRSSASYYSCKIVDGRPSHSV